MTTHDETRLQMSGVPVRFVKWSERGLVYAGMGVEHDLSTLSRGMVKRMLRDGLLEIEGWRPEWVAADD